MRKFTQKELLDEGFWGKFAGKALSGARRVAETGRQIAKVAAPEFYDPIAKVAQWRREAGASISDKAKPWQRRIEDWVKEQGRFPISEVKKLKSYRDGTRHFSVDIAEKGVDKDTGEEVAGKIFKDPHSVVSYNPKDGQYRWVIKPRSDSYARHPNKQIKYGHENARRADDPDPSEHKQKKLQQQQQVAQQQQQTS